MWFGVVGKGGYDRGEVEIGIGRGRGGRVWRGWGGLLGFSLPLSGVAVLEISEDGREEDFSGYGAVVVELGEAKKWLWEGWKLGQGRGGRGVRWLGWPEVAVFGGTVLVPGRAGGRSGGPVLLLSVR